MFPEINPYLRFENNGWMRSILRLGVMIVYGSMYDNIMTEMPSYASYEADPIAMILALFDGRSSRPEMWAEDMQNFWENMNGL